MYRAFANLLACVCIAVAMTPALSFAMGVPIKPLTAQCLTKSASEFQIHPDVLLAILLVEGGTVGKNSRQNDNGSYDIGIFQINTIHRSAIAKLGITEEQLRNDGCISAAVAAWHLRNVVTPQAEAAVTNKDEYLSLIARYHSFTPSFNRIYAKKLEAAFEYLYSKQGLSYE